MQKLQSLRGGGETPDMGPNMTLKEMSQITSLHSIESNGILIFEIFLKILN